MMFPPAATWTRAIGLRGQVWLLYKIFKSRQLSKKLDYIKLYIILCLTSDSDPLGLRGLLLIYMWGENSIRENPVICLPAFRIRLLGACLAPAGRLWYSKPI